MTDRLKTLQVLVAVVDQGGFARAARALRMSPPAVTRAIAELETRIGARLVNRTTRHVSPTDAGVALVAAARQVLADVDAAERLAAGESDAPGGPLAITASETMGRAIVGPIAYEFARAHPRIRLSMSFSNRVVNLLDEGIDVAVRVGSLPDSSLVARKVGDVYRVLVASPVYVRRLGLPRTPRELRDHELIGFTGLTPGRDWRFEERGRIRSVQADPVITVNDALTAINGAVAGYGITLALSYMVAEELRSGRLVRVMPRFTPAPVPVHIVHAQGRLMARRVRAFVDFASPRLAAALQRPART